VSGEVSSNITGIWASDYLCCCMLAGFSYLKLELLYLMFLYYISISYSLTVCILTVYYYIACIVYVLLTKSTSYLSL
jgi:hypothetical protein